MTVPSINATNPPDILPTYITNMPMTPTPMSENPSTYTTIVQNGGITTMKNFKKVVWGDFIT